MDWHNPPAELFTSGDIIRLTTRPQTDFWRKTHYGFIRDTGHLGYLLHAGDLTASVRIRGNYQVLYDQAGVMIRGDERTWLKAGIEYTDGVAHLSVVVTNDHSDWSVIPLPGLAALESAGGAIDLRLTRHASVVRVEYRLFDPARPPSPWQMVRLAHLDLPPSTPIMIGIMACAPTRTAPPGFAAEFEGFSIGPAITKDLHTQD